ncbi:MAG: dTDP-4-dehydrorhamnose 3,5-epimerase, partial [Gammaproteobacteria bacterium]
MPEGFGHGCLVLSISAKFLYKTTDFYSPEDERIIVWDDADLAIAWPLVDEPSLS